MRVGVLVKVRGKYSFAEAQGKLRVIGFEIEEKLFFLVGAYARVRVR